MNDLLNAIKAQKWFYEFPLPDGTVMESYLPPQVRAIHTTRDRALRMFLAGRDFATSTAIDVAFFDEPTAHLACLVVNEGGETARLCTSYHRRFERVTSEFNSQ